MFSSLFLFLPWTDDKGISLLSQVWWIICHWKRSGAYASSFALYNHFDGSLGKSIMQTGRVLLFFFNNIRLLWCPLWVTSNWQSLQWSKAIQWGSNFLQTIQLEKKKYAEVERQKHFLQFFFTKMFAYYKTCLVSPAVLAAVIKDIISSHNFFYEQTEATVILFHESYCNLSYPLECEYLYFLFDWLQVHSMKI